MQLRLTMRRNIGIAISSLILALLLAPVLDGYGALPQKRVLLLYSEDKEHPATELTDAGIRAAFGSNKLFDVRLYSEHLDLSRFSGRGYTRTVTDYLGRKYADSKIDVIITIYPAALDMFLGEARAGFPGVPLVACDITRIQAESLEHSPSRRLATGVVLGDNIAGILDSAFRMKPGTKHIALVAGTSANDLASERIFRKGLESYAKEIDLIDLTKLPMPETLSRVGSLPPDTIILYSALFLDGAGQSFVPRAALSLISQAANAPVFGLYESYLGYGIVGGRLVSFEQQGREAAALALRIMGGESPASIPFGGEQAYVNHYDWRELTRWGLKESDLPAGATILSKPVSAWEIYRLYIIGVAALCLLETALIIFLIVQRRRKRRAEAELRRTKEELDQFFNLSPDLLCIASTDGYFLRLNPAWEKTLGYGREELISKPFLDFVHPDDLDRTREALSTLEHQQKLFSFENRYLAKDGTGHWLEWSSAPAGNLIYSAARDITERKQTEQALRENEQRLRDIIFSQGDWVWEVDENGVYTYSSSKGLELLGNVIGKTPFDFMPPDEAERVAVIFSEIAANKAPIKDLENWNITENGARICFRTNGVPILDEEGNLKGYRGVDKDVTARKEMENRIRAAAEEWQTTFDSIPNLVMILDQDQRVVRVNAAAKSFLGLPVESILGSPCHALMHGTKDPVEGCPFAKTMQSKRPEETERYDTTRQAWFRISTDPIFNEKGEIRQMVHSVKDVTEEKRAETERYAARRELQRTERLLRMGELTASLAHELNQPLTSILNNTRAALRFIQSDNLDLKELAEILQDIADDDKRAGNIIRSLRSMVKLEVGERELTAINDVLSEVVALFHSEAIIRGIKVETDFAASLPPIQVDKVQLQQVIINLMMNAADAMLDLSKNRRIDIRTQTTNNGGVLVAIRDFGPGIDEKGLARIFEPFFTTKRSGLGLGLSLSRSIIEGQGGHIWAENNPEGGATFCFDLPGVSDQ
jgi:PAS domain S-box-containing protein